jgi:hypothetical protein
VATGRHGEQGRGGWLNSHRGRLRDSMAAGDCGYSERHSARGTASFIDRYQASSPEMNGLTI